MKVLDLKIQNVKNVPYAFIEFNDKVTYITGNNGAGKTTIIESIFQAISLTKSGLKKQEMVKFISKGQDKATIEVRIGNAERTIKIEKRITDKNVYEMALEEETGKKIGQNELNEILSEYTIDPFAFANMKAKEQIETFKTIFGINTDELELKLKEMEESRTFNNRLAKEKAAVVKEYGDINPVEKKSMNDLVTKIQEVENKSRDVEQLQRSVEKYTDEYKSIAEQIKSLQVRQEEIVTAGKFAKENLATAQAELEKLGNIDAVREEMKSIEAHNEEAMKYQKFIDAQKSAEEAKLLAEESQAKVDVIREAIQQEIMKAKLPIEKVTIDQESGIVIDGIPLTNMSSAQQIKTGTIIATANNPELKVMYIKDGSLLDENMTKELCAIAEEKGYQLLIEKVGEQQTENSIVVREGVVLPSTK